MSTALLLSGGMDSIALACWVRPRIAITIDYGQKPAEGELHAATMVCAELGIEHVVVRADCSAVGSGDLVGTLPARIAPVPEWWPFRNQLLVTLAAAAVVGREIETLLLGAVASDEAHADGRLAFVEALSRVLELQELSMKLSAPAISMTSEELVRQEGVRLDVLAWAHSCHVSAYACGWCRGCSKHRAVMRTVVQ